ncbi:hypothetical protein BT69DRAFT_1265238 [Atractiella rhizophila]|nr:hypothetical protein BT69DRAFT_1265238 [Atractiella rhizophila]
MEVTSRTLEMPSKTGTSSNLTADPVRKRFYLFGFPISHSASPAFHNLIFNELGTDFTYELYDVEDIGKSGMLDVIRSETFGGSSVTMPIKVTVMNHLDRVTPEGRAIGSCNTIFLDTSSGRTELVGTNFDWIGIRNALQSAESPSTPLNSSSPRPTFIVGGGGTARAAVYALSQLNLSPIYLINRDDSEIEALIKQFPQFDLRPLKTVEELDNIRDDFPCGVGSIPSMEPVTREEKQVYAVAERIFARQKTGVFLDMCYKPRYTILLSIADKAGWKIVEGMEAMIHQALAQSRQWMLNGKGTLPEDIEAKAAALVRSMGDITPKASDARAQKL